MRLHKHELRVTLCVRKPHHVPCAARRALAPGAWRRRKALGIGCAQAKGRAQGGAARSDRTHSSFCRTSTSVPAASY
eukprot:scaffold15440_cov139-Isochrysis_galbana.AAC.3